MTALYLAHYRPLVRLAALLVQDLATAEEIVQGAFVAVHAAWHRLPDAGHAQALASLRAELGGTSDDEHVIAPPEARPRP